MKGNLPLKKNNIKDNSRVNTKKILIFLSSYFPEINANVICAQLYIDVLKRCGYKIDLITCGNGEKDGVLENKNEVCVYRFNNWYISKIKKINNMLGEVKNKKGLKSKLSMLYLLMQKVFLHISDWKNADLVSCNLDINAIVKLVEQSEEKYCLMLAFNESFSMPWIASKIKSQLNYNIPFLVCEFDPFTRNMGKSSFLVPKRKYAEKGVLSKADKVMIPPELEIDYERDFPEFKFKTVIQYFPNLIELNVPNKVSNTREIVCSYAGSFNKIFRNPQAFLEIVNKIAMRNLKIHIYGGGCEEIIEQYTPVLDGKLIWHGYKDMDVVFEAQCESDILINLGNSMNNMLPSKLLEIMAMGKPIIHFYRTDTDTCKKYLEQYPCALFIDERNNYLDSAITIEKFILENKGKRFSYSEVTKNLQEMRSDNVCAKFLSEIEKMLG